MCGLTELDKKFINGVNVRQQLLDKGELVIYSVKDLPADEFVTEYPDGRKLVTREKNGKYIECEAYEG